MKLIAFIIAISIFNCVFFANALAGEQLNSVAIRDLLAGKTVTGKMGPREFQKKYMIDGTFLITVKDFTLNGTWRVANNHYCQTMEGKKEACYSIEKDASHYKMFDGDKLHSTFTSESSQ